MSVKITIEYEGNTETRFCDSAFMSLILSEDKGLEGFVVGETDLNLAIQTMLSAVTGAKYAMNMENIPEHKQILIIESVIGKGIEKSKDPLKVNYKL